MALLARTYLTPCRSCACLWRSHKVPAISLSVGWLSESSTDILPVTVGKFTYSKMTVRHASYLAGARCNVSPYNGYRTMLSSHLLSAKSKSLSCRTESTGSNWKHTCSEPQPQIENDSYNKNISSSVDQSVSELNKSPTSEYSPGESENTRDPSISKTPTIKKGKRKNVDYDWIRPEGLDTGIKMYNSLTRQKEPLILPAGRLATWYSCGPTVYDHAHIGHASSYVRTDIIRRILMNFFSIDVVFVMGITDIDDKIIKRSKETGIAFRHLGRYFETEFFKEMDSLKVLAPTVTTRVSDHIPEIIGFIHRIIDNGYAYITPDGTVYFDVTKYGRYGKLHTLSSEDSAATIRVEVDTGKKNPRDFALWKAAKPKEPWWESPWGNGRPGWHIECSTMASTIFGSQLDIHSGGDDLRFPHHENEVAQSEACFCSSQWTNYWLHTGFLHQKNEKIKMSKSLKNAVRLSDLLSHYTADQFRMFCMLRPYRQLIEYNEETMEKAVKIHNHWATFQTDAHSYIHGQMLCKPINDAHLLQSLEETKQKIEAALADDFDTPKAVVALEELVRRTNVELKQNFKSEAECTVRSPGVVAAVAAYVDRIMELFGIQISRKKKLTQMGVDGKLSTVLDSVLQFRGEVRRFALKPDVPQDLSESVENKKNQVKPLLQACDRLRDDLSIVGVNIQDHNKESSWDMVDNTSLASKKTKMS